jgi:hypothetical protein
MKRHSTIRALLYEYATSGLSSTERSEVEGHLRQCRHCASRLDDIRTILAALPPPGRRPSEERSPEFWQSLSDSVQRSIGQPVDRIPSLTRRVFEEITLAFAFNRRTVTLATGALVVAVLAFVVLRGPGSIRHAADSASVPTEVRMVDTSAQRMNQLLRQSKTLLVGLSNMRTDGTLPLDLRTERVASRRLLNETRELRRRPLDAESARLLDDIEPVMIKLANSSDQVGVPDIELIRSGIRRQNLLFKIRMAENVYGAGTAMPVREQK